VVWNQLVNIEEGGWASSGLCNAYVFGVGYQGQQMFATVNIPYESTTASNSATIWLYTYGANANGWYGVGQLCADIYAYDENGNFASNSGAVCTSGTNMRYQWLAPSVYVPALGTVVTQVGGQAGAKIMQTILGYQSNGV
jgi:hypothetical protein